ncbi:MAG: hypothetical protein FWG88_11940 [Oscillospiraceae bacterium]|nr:hypothetical protein [Oscillospiraceae bacterium]
MKKFLQTIAALKAVAALAFTAQIMVVTVATMLLRKNSIPISYIWQMVFLALIFSAVQILAFSENRFEKTKTSARLTFLGLTMLFILACFAIAFKWFPLQNPVNWIAFTGSYIAVFFVSLFTLRIVFRLGGIEYTQMLNVYKGQGQGQG